MEFVFRVFSSSSSAAAATTTRYPYCINGNNWRCSGVGLYVDVHVHVPPPNKNRLSAFWKWMMTMMIVTS